MRLPATALALVVAATLVCTSTAPVRADEPDTPPWGFDGHEVLRPPADAAELLSGVYDRPWRGGEHAAVTLVVFSDFQCPHCARLDHTLESLLIRYGQRIRIVFRHMPLSTHDQARAAAELAAGAHLQRDAFWSVHDQLFALEAGLDAAALQRVAASASLDTALLEQERADAAAVVDEDLAWAAHLGVNGTPATFVNGRLLDGAQPELAFDALIDEELARAERLEGVADAQRSAALTRFNLEELGGTPGAASLPVPPRIDLPDTVPVLGADDALLEAVAFVAYRDAAGARELDLLVDALRRQYGRELRVAWHMLPRGLDAVETWLGALALASAETAAFEATHRCLLELASEGALGLCADDAAAGCTESLEQVQEAARAGLVACGLDGDDLVARVGPALLELAEDGRRLARRHGLRERQGFALAGATWDGVPLVRDALAHAELALARAQRLADLVPRAELAALAAMPAVQAERVWVDTAARPAVGPDDAPVTLIEFSDFECPYCLRVQPTLEALRERYGDQLRIEFVHMPLDFHDQADDAARAAWAAWQQGDFEAYHQQLFANQKGLGDALYTQLAQERGLDLDRFEDDRSSSAAQRAIEADKALATAAGARGTPYFLVNGRAFSGARSLDAFAEVIDEELALAEALAPRLADAGADLFTFTARDDALGSRAKTRVERQHVELSGRPVDGPDDAPVTLVAFSDYQCPFCSRADATVTALREHYGDQLRVAFVHLPLSFHDQADDAARAAWAAQEQGQFWPYSALLFANQQALGDALYTELATELGLDLARFEQDRLSDAATGAIGRDQLDAARVGATGTPTFLVNGVVLGGGALPFDAFQILIDEELAHTQALLDDGTVKKPRELYAHLTGAEGALEGDPKVRVRAKGVPRLGKARKKGGRQLALFVDPSNRHALAAMAELLSLVGSAAALPDDLEVVLVPVVPEDASAETERAGRAMIAAGSVETALHLGIALHTSTLDEPDAIFESALSAAGLDPATLADAMASKATTKALEAARESFDALGVLGDPTFLVNGVQQRGTRTAAQLRDGLGL